MEVLLASRSQGSNCLMLETWICLCSWILLYIRSLSHRCTPTLFPSSSVSLVCWSCGRGVKECSEWVGMVDSTAILRCEHHCLWIRECYVTLLVLFSTVDATGNNSELGPEFSLWGICVFWWLKGKLLLRLEWCDWGSLCAGGYNSLIHWPGSAVNGNPAPWLTCCGPTSYIRFISCPCELNNLQSRE